MTARFAELAQDRRNLSDRITAAISRRPDGADARLDDGERMIRFDTLAERFWIDAAPEALAGRNVVLRTRSAFAAALALASLDGLAARMVLCPPDLSDEHLPGVISAAEADAIVHDLLDATTLPPGTPAYAISDGRRGAGLRPTAAPIDSEWALFTSGTTGAPKMVVHSLAGLTDAFAGRTGSAEQVIWATFYDTRRFGGLQMLLRALTGGHAMILTTPDEPVATFLERLADAGATHISGTPSHWRRALMTPGVQALSPRYVRLSGEIADQAVLDSLARAFPGAQIGHAYASTEAGVGFEVGDGLEGFPESFLDRDGPVEMQVRDGVLRIRSARTAARYLGDGGPVADADGFVDTGDLVERRGERLHFTGRANGVVNVGGLKVHPEEVEAVINRHPAVRMALVKGRRNPITGAILTAEVVLEAEIDAADRGEAGRQILDYCRAELAAFKVPASLKFVEVLPMTAGGKLDRRHA